MALSHFLKVQFSTLLIILIKSAPHTTLAVTNQCQEDFDLDTIDDEEELFGRFEFSCDGCCDYDETIDKAKIEEVIMEYLNEEFTCLGAGNEGDVLYVSLDTWVEGLDCSPRQLDSHRRSLRQRQRRLESKGGANYSSCKDCKKKKNKKNNRLGHLHRTINLTVIDGVEDRDIGVSSLLAQTGFGLVLKQEESNTIQATDDIASMMDAFKSSTPKSKATETKPPQTKASKSKKTKKKAQKSKSPTTKTFKAKKPKTPKTKSFKKSSASPTQFPSATPNIEECTIIPQSCQRSMRRKERNLQVVDITSLIEKLKPVFPTITNATPVSNVLVNCAYGTSACSSSAGTCCGAIGCECNTVSESLCKLEECCIYQETTFDIDFCASIGDCDSKQCFEPPPPSEVCNGTTIPPKCCHGINGEPLSPDFCAGVFGCPDNLGYCVNEDIPTLAPSPEPTKVPTTNPTESLTPQPPTKVPITNSTESPTPQLTKAPTTSSTETPTPQLTNAPTTSSTESLTPQPPTKIPITNSTESPAPQPTKVPTTSPTESLPPLPTYVVCVDPTC